MHFGKYEQKIESSIYFFIASLKSYVLFVTSKTKVTQVFKIIFTLISPFTILNILL